MSPLPNRRDLHALAKSLSGTSKAYETCVNIEGPPKGTYTSYRVTEAGREIVINAAEQQADQGTLFGESPDVSLVFSGERCTKLGGTEGALTPTAPDHTTSVRSGSPHG